MNAAHSVLLIAIAAVITYSLRAVPFVLFGRGRQMPPIIKKISDLLPPAIMAVLVIYCLKADIFAFSMSSLASFIGVAVTAVVHLWKRNVLFSIASGTVVYMACLHLLPGIL